MHDGTGTGVLLLIDDDVSWSQTLMRRNLLDDCAGFFRINRWGGTGLSYTLAFGIGANSGTTLKNRWRIVSGIAGILQNRIIRCERDMLPGLPVANNKVDRFAFLVEHGIAGGYIACTIAYLVESWLGKLSLPILEKTGFGSRHTVIIQFIGNRLFIDPRKNTRIPALGKCFRILEGIIQIIGENRPGQHPQQPDQQQVKRMFYWMPRTIRE